jgi:hypothetical protein
MSRYNHLVKALDDLNDGELEIKAYLRSLKPYVKQLRASNRLNFYG